MRISTEVENLEKPDHCASCGTALEPRSGPGRPSAYCNEGCRRTAEFAVRSLVKRINAAEIELREIQCATEDFAGLDQDERRRRTRFLRRWLVEDRTKLRALLGGNNQTTMEKSAESNRGSNDKSNGVTHG